MASFDWFAVKLLNWVNVCKKRISPDPMMVICGSSPEGNTQQIKSSSPLQLNSNQTGTVSFVTLLARKLILVNWKSPDAPTHEGWLEGELTHLKLEKWRRSSQGCTQRLHNVWPTFIDYFNEKRDEITITLTLNPDS